MVTLTISNLSYEYNEQLVLKDLSLKARSGEFVIILGRSGSGKSTLLYLISKLLKKQKGEIIYNPTPNIGLVFQVPTLLSDFNVLENVALPLITAGIKEKDALIKAQNILKRFKIEELSERKIFELSGGQLSRVQIARTLINDPDVLLLDEPTGALDQNNAIELMKIFKDLSKTKLVIMVTHREQLAFSFASKVYYLTNGRLKSINKSEVKDEKE